MMPEAEREDLLDEVIIALGDMTERTCADMRPLWLRLSLSLRRQLLRNHDVPLPDYPAHLSTLTKSPRSKYMALAGWRHAVVWRDLLERSDVFSSTEAHTGLTLVYFQRYPENRPPYSYSQRTSAAPGQPTTWTTTQTRIHAEQGCIDALRTLRADRERYREEEDYGYRFEFLSLGLRRSLCDVLKLEHADDLAWTDDPDD